MGSEMCIRDRSECEGTDPTGAALAAAAAPLAATTFESPGEAKAATKTEAGAVFATRAILAVGDLIRDARAKVTAYESETAAMLLCGTSMSRQGAHRLRRVVGGADAFLLLGAVQVGR